MLPVDREQSDPGTSVTVLVVTLKFPGLGLEHSLTKMLKKKQENKTNNNIWAQMSFSCNEDHFKSENRSAVNTKY